MASLKDTVILTFHGQQITSNISDIPLYQAIVTRVLINQPGESRLQDILDSLQAALDFGGFGMTIDIYSKNLFEALAIAKSTGSFPDISKIKKTTKSKKEEKPKLKRFDSGDFEPPSPTFLERDSSSPLRSLVRSTRPFRHTEPEKPTTVRLGIIPTTPSMAAKEFIMWFDILPKLAESKMVDNFIKECKHNSIFFEPHENIPLPKILIENFLKEKFFKETFLKETLKKNRIHSVLNPMKD